jgi:hypothetical protein
MFMTAAYGYIKDTMSMEPEDEMDFFLCPNGDGPSGKVYVIAMLDNTGGMEEEKAFLNFKSRVDAETCFDMHYSEAKRAYTYVMSDDDFVAMLRVLQLSAQHKLSDDPIDTEDSDGEESDGCEVLDLGNYPEDLSEKSLKGQSLMTLSKSLPTDQRLALLAARAAVTTRRAVPFIPVEGKDLLEKGLQNVPLKDHKLLSTFRSKIGPDGLADIDHILSFEKSLGGRGKGILPGEQFRPEQASVEDWQIVKLAKATVDVLAISAALKLPVDDVRSKMKSWRLLK